MTGDGNLFLILSLSYLYLISSYILSLSFHRRYPSPILHSIFISTVTIPINSFCLPYIYIFSVPTYKLSVVSTHPTESEYYIPMIYLNIPLLISFIVY